MSDTLTKKDIQEMFAEHQQIVLDAVDSKVGRLETKIDKGFNEAQEDRNDLRASIRELSTSLDAFLKRLTDHEDEFKIMKAEMVKIKMILKEKLDVEVVL